MHREWWAAAVMRRFYSGTCITVTRAGGSISAGITLEDGWTSMLATLFLAVEGSCLVR